MIPDGQGGFHRTDDRYDFSYFLRFEPLAMAGYSIHIYHITLDGANDVRRELGLRELTGNRIEPP